MNNPKVHHLFELITREEERQKRSLALIASENFVSPNVRHATGSVLTNKYAEGLPHKRYYGGCEVVDQVEEQAQELAKALYGASWVNVQPHSGSQANAAVMLAVLKPGDKLLGFDLTHGGHLTHGSPFNFSGKLYKPAFYGVEQDTECINWDKVAEKARQEKPKLIICGASSYSRDWDYERLRAIADEVGALLLADIAHTAGLIARGLLKNAVAHCHIVTTTTHKTLRGPRGGMILMGKDMDNQLGIKTKRGTLKQLSKILDNSVFPGTQGGPFMHAIAGKAVAFSEALTESYYNYIQSVQRNARHMAQHFIDLGYKVVSGGTDNHLILIDLRSKNITGQQAEQLLSQADIIVNKNMVPFDHKPAQVTSGIRLGTAAITTRGLQGQDITQIVSWIDQVLRHPQEALQVKKQVNNYMRPLPLHIPVKPSK